MNGNEHDKDGEDNLTDTCNKPATLIPPEELMVLSAF
jgi:hypothetical protein